MPSIKMVSLGSGAERDLDDYRLSRLACYLIAQNGNPRKKDLVCFQHLMRAITSPKAKYQLGASKVVLKLSASCH